MNKTFAILGGGTAGWMTALYLQKSFPKTKIILVESEEIGILGAGEGTTPHFINFLDFLDIPVSILMKEADATIKNGIKFTNWNNEKDYYYHSFQSFNGLGLDSCNQSDYLSKTCLSYIYNVANNEKIENIDFIEKISEKGLVPFQKNGYLPELMKDPILCFNRLSNFGIHFNASKVAKVFSKIAINRGVERVEGKVEKIISNSFGDIESFILNNGKIISADFFIDCSGFARVIIGKHFNAEWVSHNTKLTVDSAIPFFLQHDNEKIEPYTEAIAMKYGWVWKIPTQERFGCGYVFDSKFTNKEDALNELQEYFKVEINSPKSFNFNAGYYKTPWIKNCLSVGLSSGFIEPLEATSLWTTILQLKMFFSDYDSIVNRNDLIIENFNKSFSKIINEVVDFLYFHYITKRKDTDFWKQYTEDNAPDNVQTLNKLWNVRVPYYSDIQGHIFGLESWMSVLVGLDQHKKSIMKRVYENYSKSLLNSNLYMNYKNNINENAKNCYDHKEFINFLITK